METLGSRLKKAREKTGLTQMEVAKKLGISNGTLSGYERNYRDPDTETLKTLATLYGVSPNLLTGYDESLSRKEMMLQRSQDIIQQAVSRARREDGPPVDQFISIPIYGEIKAGYGMVAEQLAIGYEVVAKKDIEDGDYFYLIVKGDSMIEEGIKDGCRVLVRQQDHVENGKIGVVLVDGEEGTLKRVYYQDDTVILQASNRDIPPRILPMDDVKIQGQVKRFEVDV